METPFWRCPRGAAREGTGHLRVWAMRLLLRVTWLLSLRLATSSPSLICRAVRAGLARRYGPSLVLLEHHLAPGSGEGMETLNLVRIGADQSPHWSRVWPTPEENPRHAGLERWMAAYGYQIVGRAASWFDRGDDTNR